MTEARMSLAEAAKLLGIAPNSVRSRFKAGKIRGERDNEGKIWVWIDPSSIEPTSKPVRNLPSNPPPSTDEVVTLKVENATLRTKLEEREKAHALVVSEKDARIADLRAALERRRGLFGMFRSNPKS